MWQNGERRSKKIMKFVGGRRFFITVRGKFFCRPCSTEKVHECSKDKDTTVLTMPAIELHAVRLSLQGDEAKRAILLEKLRKYVQMKKASSPSHNRQHGWESRGSLKGGAGGAGKKPRLPKRSDELLKMSKEIQKSKEVKYDRFDKSNAKPMTPTEKCKNFIMRHIRNVPT